MLAWILRLVYAAEGPTLTEAAAGGGAGVVCGQCVETLAVSAGVGAELAGVLGPVVGSALAFFVPLAAAWGRRKLAELRAPEVEDAEVDDHAEE